MNKVANFKSVISFMTREENVENLIKFLIEVFQNSKVKYLFICMYTFISEENQQKIYFSLNNIKCLDFSTLYSLYFSSSSPIKIMSRISVSFLQTQTQTLKLDQQGTHQSQIVKSDIWNSNTKMPEIEWEILSTAQKITENRL